MLLFVSCVCVCVCVCVYEGGGDGVVVAFCLFVLGVVDDLGPSGGVLVLGLSGANYTPLRLNGDLPYLPGITPRYSVFRVLERWHHSRGTLLLPPVQEPVDSS